MCLWKMGGFLPRIHFNARRNQARKEQNKSHEGCLAPKRHKGNKINFEGICNFFCTHTKDFMLIEHHSLSTQGRTLCTNQAHFQMTHSRLSKSFQNSWHQNQLWLFWSETKSMSSSLTQPPELQKLLADSEQSSHKLKQMENSTPSLLHQDNQRTMREITHLSY